MLRLSQSAYASMIGHAYDGLPDEACGLLLGDRARGTAPIFFPTRNAAKSSRIYSIGPDLLDAEDRAEAEGLELMGVVHSHTHTDPYPSPTDVEAALEPSWRYVIVSLRDEAPMVRSYWIVDGTIAEEPIQLIGG